jgi:hypothetical protein
MALQPQPLEKSSITRRSLIKRPEVYQYAPLPKGDYIRYLVLEPGRGSDPLVCNLYTSLLTELPYFEAISYVWGGCRKVTSIRCDGKIIPITENLRSVLQAVRLPELQRTLWADSVCINQDDKTEQGHQVGIMRKIYGLAKKTLIYIDPDNGCGEGAASLLAHMNIIIENQLKEFDSWDQIPDLHRDDPIAHDPRWKSMRALIERPWFRRVWVVQEAAISSDARILCGSAEIKWTDLIRLETWLQSKAKFVWHENRLFLNDVFLPNSWSPIDPDHVLYAPLTSVHKSNFVELLARQKPLGCTVAKDRVYAFLGSPSAQWGFDNEVKVTPDYHKSDLDVFQEMARQWLVSTGDLNILSAVEHTSATLDSKVSSWVPIWDQEIVFDHFGLHGREFKASSGTNQPTLRFDGSSLCVRGLLVDIIHFRSEHLERCRWKHPENTISNAWWYLFEAPRNNRAFTSIWKYISNPSTKFAYENGDRLLNFCRTLRAKRDYKVEKQFGVDEASFCLALCKKSNRFNGVNVSALEELAQSGDSWAFASATMTWTSGRRFIVTNIGRYGLAPYITKEGDVCCVLYGMQVPVILRRVNKQCKYKLIGEAFILGLMQGQAVQNMEKWGLSEQEFVLC